MPYHHRMPKWLFALLQALLVSLYVLGAFLAIYQFHSKLAMASIAASAFIAFAFPLAETSRPKYFIGGYLCGVFSGGLLCVIRYELPEGMAQDGILLIVFSALSVFLTVFLMVVLKLQHPSACGLAISMVMEDNPIGMGISMVLCIVALCFIKWLMVKIVRPYMPEGSGNAPSLSDEDDGPPGEGNTLIPDPE